MPYDRAILYGRYAGSRMRSEIGGYELLLVTRSMPTVEGWQIEPMLDICFPREIREESRIRIETVQYEFMERSCRDSWFYAGILSEGIILYDNGSIGNPLPAGRSLTPEAAAGLRRRYEFLYGAAGDMLRTAVRMWNKHRPELAAVSLSHAATLMLRAEETVFYGAKNQIHTTQILPLFKRVRHYSRALANGFRPEDEVYAEFFENLTAYRDYEAIDPAQRLTWHKYKSYFRRLCAMQECIKISCQRHIHFLEYGRTLAKTVTEAEASERPAEQDGDEGHGRKPADAEERAQAVAEKQTVSVVPAEPDGDDGHGMKPAGAQELTQAVAEKQTVSVVPAEPDGHAGEQKAVAADIDKKIDQKVDRYSDKDKAACGGEPAEDIRERFDPGTD